MRGSLVRSLRRAGAAAIRRLAPLATACARIVGTPLAHVFVRVLQRTRLKAGVAVLYHEVAERPGDPGSELVPAFGVELFESQMRHLRRLYRLPPGAGGPAAAALPAGPGRGPAGGGAPPPARRALPGGGHLRRQLVAPRAPGAAAAQPARNPRDLLPARRGHRRAPHVLVGEPPARVLARGRAGAGAGSERQHPRRGGPDPGDDARRARRAEPAARADR